MDERDQYSGLQSDAVHTTWRDPRLLREVGDLCTSLTRKALYIQDKGMGN